LNPEDIAEWMLAELERDGLLYQDEAVFQIEKRFGTQFAPTNDNGNPSIRKDVLKAFGRISGDGIVWERGERLWRRRDARDDPGRQQI
jgi:hypothetical protein